jgi:hypothetical protein
LRARHPILFQKETYAFQPNNNLVMTMPFNYINQLKSGKWTPLEKKSLKTSRNKFDENYTIGTVLR